MGLLGRQLGIAAFTVVEAAGLVVWLALATGTVPVDLAVSGVTIPPGALGVGFLLLALFVEQALTDATVNGVGPQNLSRSSAAIAATETTLWVAWLLAAEAIGGLVGVATAGVLLAILLVPQHTVEDLVLQDQESLAQGLGYWSLPVSVVEALGATVLLALLFDPGLLVSVGSATDLGLLETVRSTVNLALLDAIASPPDVNAGLAGASVLAGFLFVEHNLAVQFTLQTDEASSDQPEQAIVQ